MLKIIIIIINNFELLFIKLFYKNIFEIILEFLFKKYLLILNQYFILI